MLGFRVIASDSSTLKRGRAEAMTPKSKTLSGTSPKGFQMDSADRSNDQARLKYTTFRLDDKIPEAFSRLRKATPERRLCVYGVPESVPFLRGWGWSV